ncbi:15511_t:CDS:2, partial [Dentiscutata heterogama]
MDINTDDLYEAEVRNTSASDSQDVLQVSDDNDNMATSTATASNRNIVSPFTSVTFTKKAKSRSPVSPYFSQRTIDNIQQLFTFTPEITISSQSLIPAQKTKLHMLIAEWIVSNMLSFSIISSRSFATMLQYLNAKVDLLSRKTMKSIIQSAFVIIQKDVKTLLEQAPNNKWNLRKILLDICMLPHPHTGEEIDTYLHFVFAAFKITDKIFCATTDGSSNMILAMQLLK